MNIGGRLFIRNSLSRYSVLSPAFGSAVWYCMNLSIVGKGMIVTNGKKKIIYIRLISSVMLSGLQDITKQSS